MTEALNEQYLGFQEAFARVGKALHGSGWLEEPDWQERMITYLARKGRLVRKLDDETVQELASGMDMPAPFSDDQIREALVKKSQRDWQRSEVWNWFEHWNIEVIKENNHEVISKAWFDRCFEDLDDSQGTTHVEASQGTDTCTLEPPTIEPRNRGGRPRQWRWDDMYVEIIVRASADRLPETQADLERDMADWFMESFGDQPSDSMIRLRIGPIYHRLRQRRNP